MHYEMHVAFHILNLLLQLFTFLSVLQMEFITVAEITFDHEPIV